MNFTILILFIIMQLILLLFITFHDWVHIPPLTDIRELEKHHSFNQRLTTSIVFFFIVFIPLLLTWIYQDNFKLWVLITLIVFYGLLTLGTILSWWIPYFFGSSEEQKKAFAEYENTHHFLPARGDNTIPNTFHVIMHLVIWTCFAIALYLLIHFLRL